MSIDKKLYYKYNKYTLARKVRAKKPLKATGDAIMGKIFKRIVSLLLGSILGISSILATVFTSAYYMYSELPVGGIIAGENDDTLGDLGDMSIEDIIAFLNIFGSFSSMSLSLASIAAFAEKCSYCSCWACNSVFVSSSSTWGRISAMDCRASCALR